MMLYIGPSDLSCSYEKGPRVHEQSKRVLRKHTKVIAFCTNALVTKLAADLLSKLHLDVCEIHARKQYNYRTRVSNVSTGRIDSPDVTLVIQTSGCQFYDSCHQHQPSSYHAILSEHMHLGRTGRKGKEGAC